MKIAVALVAGILIAAMSASPGFAASRSSACFDYHQAPKHVGETGCVSGAVLHVYTSRSDNTFLDFCPNYRTCPFSGVIFASDSNKFGGLESLTGRRVEIHGFIRTYQGRAEIVIRDPSQIHRAP